VVLVLHTWTYAGTGYGITPAAELALTSAVRARDHDGEPASALDWTDQWRYLGTGPKAGRVGRHLRYDHEDVKAWFRQRQAAAWTVYDRWHKRHPPDDDRPCAEHSRGGTKLYPTAEHLMGDRWQVRWRDETGIQRSRKFPKRKGTNPETCAEVFDAQRAAETARGERIDPRIGRTTFRDYAPVWMTHRCIRPAPWTPMSCT
jgi:hypothetical protein